MATKPPWQPSPDESGWDSPEVTRKVLGEVPEPIPLAWAQSCAFRLHRLRDELRSSWVGLGPLTDWLLAALTARENALLLGPPGLAKSEIATRTFKLLGLSAPKTDDSLGGTLDPSRTTPQAWWQERGQRERQSQKYFHYLLSRFTQPEELFGPVEISLLRQGILARVNFGLLTGPGVRAAFLDEIFKASSSILNTLLTLTQERTYFNWGGMVSSDLMMFIGASNEMPGGFATGMAGMGSGGEDFQTLHAFIDRFPVRLEVPSPSGTSAPKVADSHLAQAFDKAIGREAEYFRGGDRFGAGAGKPAHMPSINDVLLLGRACLQQEAGTDVHLFRLEELQRFRRAFLQIAADLQKEGTSAAGGHLTWTISPRKLRSLYKVGLAHALVRGEGFAPGGAGAVTLRDSDLNVFDLIWDTPAARSDLSARVESLAAEHWERGR
jgi:MoxR-like ATPase